jgi:hypothetical protein
MKRLTLNIGNAQNAKAINDQLDTLMNYPGWTDTNAEAWLDMVTLYESQVTLVPRFRAVTQEMFLIDVVADRPMETIPGGLMNALHSQIAQVNRISVRKIGRPILALLWS